jgi:hypothetical protein
MVSDSDVAEKGDEEMAESPNEKSSVTDAQKSEVPSKAKKAEAAAAVMAIEYVQIPHPHDILSGRGNGANQHPGNIFFRCLIQRYKHRYIHTGPSEKKSITKRIVDDVFSRDPPGRFLKQATDSEEWEVLDYEKVLKKTGQALREKAPELKRKSLEEANFLLRRSIIAQNGLERPMKKPNLGLDLITSRKQVELAQIASSSAAFGNLGGSLGNPQAFQPQTFQTSRMMGVPQIPHQMRRIPLQNDHSLWDDAASRSSKRKFNELNTMNPMIPLTQNGLNGTSTFKIPPPSPASAHLPLQQVLPYSNVLKATSPHSSQAAHRQQQAQASMQQKFKSSRERNLISLTHSDVIVGRTEMAKTHVGNVMFRDLVAKFKSTYNNSSTVQKMHVTKHIIDKIIDKKPQGRFLKLKSDTGRWEPVAIDIVIEKTNEALRDNTPELRRPIKIETAPEIKHVLQKPIIRREIKRDSPKYISEKVNGDGRSSDPPGTFFNYYSAIERDQDVNMEDDTLSQKRDPPGNRAKDLKKIGAIPMKVSPAKEKNKRSPTEVNDLSGFDTERLNLELQRRQREHALQGHLVERPLYLKPMNRNPVDLKKRDPPV